MRSRVGAVVEKEAGWNRILTTAGAILRIIPFAPVSERLGMHVRGCLVTSHSYLHSRANRTPCSSASIAHSKVSFVLKNCGSVVSLHVISTIEPRLRVQFPA